MCVDPGWKFGERIFWSETLRSWKHLDASEIRAGRPNAKEVLATKKVNFSFSRSQVEQQNCLEEIMESENPLQGGKEPQGVKISWENFQRNSEMSQPTEETKDDAGARNDFWSMAKVTSFIVITLNLGFPPFARLIARWW